MKLKTLFFLAVTCVYGTVLFASGSAKLTLKDLNAPSPSVIWLYPQWKYKALTFSYDDAPVEDKRLVEIFNRRGLKGTFNISSGRTAKKHKMFLKWSEMKGLYKGHEVASHGKNHLKMPQLAPEKIHSEIADDMIALRELNGVAVRGFAYPYGQSSPEMIKILRKNKIEYARKVGASKRFALPTNFMHWYPSAHHNSGISGLADRFIALSPKRPVLFFIWGHSYEFERKNNWHVIEDFCQKISGKKDIWYATNIEICEYIKAGRAIVFSHGRRAGKNNSSVCLYLLVNGKKVTLPPGASYIMKDEKFITIAPQQK